MNKILLFILGAILTLNGFSQKKIDRSKQPKPGPAPVITIKDPVIFNLDNGMTILVVEDHKLPRVTATFSIDRGPVIEGSKAGVSAIMGQMLGEGTTKTPKDKFDEKIDQMGANVSLNANGGFTSALSRYFETAFLMMAEALQSPAFPDASFEKIKSMTITGLKSNEKSASAISGRVVRALSFGKKSAQGEFETEESIKGLTITDVQNTYNESITPSRSYLTFVGDITPDAARTLATNAFGNWQGKKLGIPSAANADNVVTTEIDFVDVPSAVQGEISIGNLLNNPLSNPDYHALMIANQILGGGAESKLFMNLREKHGFTYGSYSKIGNGRFQTQFSVNAQVRNEKADSAVVEMLNEINNMRDGKISNEELENAKAKYNGSFALAMEDPEKTASYATNILINNLQKDYYKNFLQKINAVTIADVQRVSQKYLLTDNSRIVIVGNGSKILPNLARLKIPIKKYDKYANFIEDKTANEKTVKDLAGAKTDGVSPSSVILKYLIAVGGKEEIKKLNTIKASFTMDLMGRNIEGLDVRMSPNKHYTLLKMGEMKVMESVFDGKMGYRSQMGRKSDLEEDEIKEASDDRGIIAQLYYLTSDYKIEFLGTERLDEEYVNKIKVTKPSGKVSTEFYSVKSGLLVREETTSLEGEMEVTVSLDYSNYKKVKNLALPYTIVQTAGEQEFTMNMTEIKINEDVTEDNFK